MICIWVCLDDSIGVTGVLWFMIAISTPYLAVPRMYAFFVFDSINKLSFARHQFDKLLEKYDHVFVKWGEEKAD